MKDVKISDYLWFQEGPGVRNTQYTTSGVKLINVANLVDGNVDLSTSDRYISEEEAYGKYNHFLADDRDFVIASSGIKIDYFDKKMGFIKKEHLPLCMNTSCIRFKVLDTNNLEIKYFMYYLKSNSFKKQLFNQITGSAQLNFGPSHLKKMTFPLIELKEQKRIIERLDKTQNIINETKSLLSKYDTLIKSRFIEMFGDPKINSSNLPTKKFIEVVKLQRGFDLPVQERNQDGLFNVYGSNGPLDKHDSFKVKAPGIVTGRSGTLGNVYYVLEDYWPLNTTLFSVDIHNNNVVYLKYLLELYDLSRFSEGAGVPTLNRNIVHDKDIIDVPLSLQNDFAAFVQQIDKSKFAVQKSLEKAETLYKSLMQEYFA